MSQTRPNSSRTFARRPFLSASAALLGLTTLSACGATKNTTPHANSSATLTPSASPSPKKFTGTVEAVPAKKTTEYNPTHPVTLTVTGGTLSNVTLKNEDGESVNGEYNADKTVWTSAETLNFKDHYTMSWTAEDPDGGKTNGTSTFSTVSAAYEADANTNIINEATYGVGMPIEIRFSEPVIDKASMEKAITITTDKAQPGKFRWYSDHMVRYRPENYWAPNSTVTVNIDILGLDFGQGMIGNANIKRTFHTGNKHYALADNNTKLLTMYVNDEQVYQAPITLGDPEWPSVTGQLVIMEQASTYFFDSGSLGLKKGDPHYYEPFWATNASRITAGGAFVHQALPSAYPYVGNANVSHGCIGLLPADAKYFFDSFRVGDILETINTGYPNADPDDGYGDWNIPFEHYDDESYVGNW
ncbi:Ig-like domain-containing protein [Rothia sp. P7181]|uniref:L,D-transpeptidase n=1 Tax=unclassified Rothia (in: high G+C Gram-positive bacteria) TaxID=2689056 RepID=UPI003ABE5073